MNLFDAFDGTILYVSHDIDEAVRFCDRIAVVDAGRIMEMNTADGVVNRPQSEAGLKLSGCKNVTEVERVGDRELRLPRWGVSVATRNVVSEQVKSLGIRAFYLERAEGPGENTFRMRVDRVSDSRFERTALLSFLDRDESAYPTVSFEENEMKFLKQRLSWRVDKLMVSAEELPERGDEVWIHFPEERIYLVDR